MKDEKWIYCYSYVCKRAPSDITKGVFQTCPNCGERILVKDVLKWRNTGAVLICNVCTGTKPGCIVANDNYEILKIGPGYRVIIPERFKDS